MTAERSAQSLFSEIMSIAVPSKSRGRAWKEHPPTGRLGARPDKYFSAACRIEARSIVNMARVHDGPKEAAMKHLLTIRHAEIQFGDGHARGKHAASRDFARSMAEAGILVGADTAEEAVSYVIDVPSTEDAVDWAARFAGAARATIGVRPIWACAGMG
jgi:hypothetical protein